MNRSPDSQQKQLPAISAFVPAYDGAGNIEQVINFGVESGDQQMLDHINKRLDIERVKEAARHPAPGAAAAQLHALTGPVIKPTLHPPITEAPA